MIEIIIVAAIISLFAGLAVISVQQMYDSNKRKAMYDETRTVGVAIGIAQTDIGFYPRLNMLGLSLNQMSYYTSSGAQKVLPNMDTYGYLGGSDRVAQIAGGWQGAYTLIAETRRTFTQGAKLLCKMRLSEQESVAFSSSTNAYWMGKDASFVDWPTDVWGNPYVVYLIKMDPSLVDATKNPYGLRLINSPTENADYWSAVVSYGPNGIPGGTSYNDSRGLVDNATYKTYVSTYLTPAMLFVPGDAANGGALATPDNMKIFTLKSAVSAATSGGMAYTTMNGINLDLNSDDFKKALPGSISSANNSSTATDYATTGQYQIGIRDTGSDDIFWVF